MKKIVFSLAFVFLSMVSIANNGKEMPLLSKTNTKTTLTKVTTYYFNHPFLGDVKISFPTNALNNNSVCGFTVNWQTEQGSGSFWFDCNTGGATTTDIIKALIELFF